MDELIKTARSALSKKRAKRVFLSLSPTRYISSASRLCARLWLFSTTAARHLAPTWRGVQPCKERVQGAAVRFLIDVFRKFSETNFWSLRMEFFHYYEILRNTERKKETIRLRALCQWEIKIDVRKYIQTIIIGLYALCGHMLDNHNRAHSLGEITSGVLGYIFLLLNSLKKGGVLMHKNSLASCQLVLCQRRVTHCDVSFQTK